MVKEIKVGELETKLLGKTKPASIEDILEKKKRRLQAELEVSELERELEEEKQKREALKNKPIQISESNQTETGISDTLKELLQDPDFKKQYLAMNEEQRQNFINATTQLAALASPAAQKYLPLTITQMMPAADRGLKTKDLIDFGKYTMDLLQRTSQPPQGQFLTAKDAIDIMKYSQTLAQNTNQPSLSEKLLFNFMELLNEERKGRIEEAIKTRDRQIEELKNQPTPLDQLRHAKETLETIGIPVGQTGSSNLEFEKLRLELMDKMEERRIADARWRLEKEWEREDKLMELKLADRKESRRNQQIESYLKMIMGNLKPLISTGIQEGRKRLRGEKASKGTVELKPITFNCQKCGNPITVNPPYPRSVKCGKCGEVHHSELG